MVTKVYIREPGACKIFNLMENEKSFNVDSF